jgi:putative protein kinase ArgK-like GTPase of G3E family
MNAINNPRVYMRSLATRQSNLALSKYVADAIQVIKAANYDIIWRLLELGNLIRKLWTIRMFLYT